MGKCVYCGGTLEGREIDVARNWKGLKVTFQGIPCDVCCDCGEQYFAPEYAKLMEIVSERAVAAGEAPEIMNVREVAKYLRVSTQTVYNLLKAGKLPAAKVGREWRFTREAVIHALRVANESGKLTLGPSPQFAFRSTSGLSENDKDRLFAHSLESRLEAIDHARNSPKK